MPRQHCGLTLSFCVLLLGMVGPARAQRPIAKALIQTERPLVIAHRGNSSQAPENTLAAFRSALSTKSDLIELDYYHSADNVPVVFHDKTLDRTTDARKRWGVKKAKLTAYKSSQLFQLDAGSWFDAKYRSERIPSLRKSLDVIQSGNTTLIERKGGSAPELVTLLRRMKLTDRVVVQAFDWEFLKQAHRLEPRLTIAALGSKRVTNARLDDIKATGAKVIAWNYKDLTKADVANIHRRGWKVWCYTVNEKKHALRLLDYGVNGLITAVPREMLRWISRP